MPGDEVADRAVRAHAQAAARRARAARSSPSPRSTWSSTSLSARAERAVGRDRVRDRAQVVRGDRDADGAGRAVEQLARERLEVAVGLGLDLEDRRRPAVLPGLDDLVVPVGALDEAHDQRRRASTSRRPLEDPARTARASRAGRPAARRPPTARRRTRPRRARSSTSSVTASRESKDSMSMCRCAPSSLGVAQQAAQPPGGVALAELGRVGAQQRRERARPSPRGSPAGAGPPTSRSRSGRSGRPR